MRSAKALPLPSTARMAASQDHSLKRWLNRSAWGLITLSGMAASTLHASGLTAAGDDAEANDFFGYSLSLSGSMALIGAWGDDLAKGSTHLFRGLDQDSNDRTQHLKLAAEHGAANDYFGNAVSLSGKMALIGAWGDDSVKGSAYLFRGLDQGSDDKTHDLQLTAADGTEGDRFGGSVSLSGNMALIGAYGDESFNGSAYLIRGLDQASDNPPQAIKLTAADDDDAAVDFFGFSVSLSGNMGLIGAYNDDSFKGSAYVFRGLDQGTAPRTQDLKLTASDGASADLFGFTVSLSGNVALIAAWGDDLGKGSAYLFRGLDQGSGTRQEDLKLTASDGVIGDYFGHSVSLSGNIALIGAWGDDLGKGSAYLFRELDQGSGTQQEDLKLTASDGLAGDYFGYSGSLDVDQFLVGAYRKNSNQGKAYLGTVSSMTTANAGSSTQTISQLSFDSRIDWIIGDTTSNNHVILSQGDSAKILSESKGIFIGKSGGTSNQLDVHGSVEANFAQVKGAGSALYLGSTGTLDVTQGTGIQVFSGASLKGMGTITGSTSIESGGKISPGDSSAATLTLGSLNVKSGGILEFNLGTPNTTAGDTNDFLQINGDLSLSDAKIHVLSIGTSGSYHLLDYTGTLALNGLSVTQAPTGFTPGNFTLITNVDGEISLSFDPAWVDPNPPKPPTPPKPPSPPKNPTQPALDHLYWDGSFTKANQRVDGGTGTWSSSSSNWTTSDGKSNHLWNSTTAIFAGQGALVSLANDITFQKIEFRSPNYLLRSQNKAILKSSGSSLIEVANGSATLESDLQSAGAFTKTGAGELILKGQNSHAASTTIGEGTLHVAGQFRSGVTVPKQSKLIVNGSLLGQVQNTGHLSGAGTINGQLINGGTIAPGNSPGTLYVSGNFVQERNGTLQIEIASPTVYDRLIVGGTASLSGNLQLQQLATDLQIGDQILFLEANQVMGGFDSIQSNLDHRVRLIYTPTGLFLQLAPVSYTQVAKTASERSLAKALNVYLIDPSAEAMIVTTALDLLSANQYAAAFKAISPGFYEGVLSTGTELSHSQQQLIHQQLHARRLANRVANVPSMPSTASAKGAKAVAPEIQPESNDYRWSAWTQASGLFSSGGLSLNPGEDFESGTIAIGADYLLTEHSAVGAFVSYQEGWGNYDHSGDIDLEAVRFGVYATYQRDGWYANAILGGGQSSYDIERPIVFSNLQRSATSEPDAWEFFTSISLGYDVQLGNWSFGPQASLQYSKLHFGNFNENGAGALDLYLRDLEVESLRSYVGARVAYTFEVNDRLTIIPEIRAFWEREYIGGDSVSAQLNGGSGASFTHHFNDPDEDSIGIGAGVGAQIGDRLYTNIYYNADFGRNDDTNHVISISATYKF